MAMGLKSIALFFLILLIAFFLSCSNLALIEARPLSSSSRLSRNGTGEIESLFFKAVNNSGPSPGTGGHEVVNLTTPLGISVKNSGPSPGEGHH
ncbi:PAMP-induced secreted peptide 2-like [Pyrus communis]|uniref:PAMP-induced secreted peptide 2-like n=1 Tax=Pyrus communis TaxID=23211 RepID=UPI0035C08C5F